jgi:hypothetical protein
MTSQKDDAQKLAPFPKRDHLLLLYYLQYGPIIELTSFDEQALVY